MSSDLDNRVLGVKLGPRLMGTAVVQGQLLLDGSVHDLRSKADSDWLGQGRMILTQLLDVFTPRVVVLETTNAPPIRRTALGFILEQELRAKAHERGLIVEQMPLGEVLERMALAPATPKYRMAQQLGTEYFPQLERLAPSDPGNQTLWLQPRDRYWLHLFEALGLAWTACEKFSSDTYS